ncbi:unnamed protein product [Hymenolepis diminuta]|uniref:Catenin alpha-1 n=1 Tax=Hymenolepis diminuta TaxID=6216 RepID=A0A158QE66_HYMDI|nr:unnamed protein product [Hymenolepis diminuta]
MIPRVGRKSIGDLLRRAEDITLECPDVVDNFRVALSEVQNIGRHFHHSVSLFLDNPIDEEAHAELLRASRSLLSSATRILILADLVDVNQLHSCLENIKGDAECIGILTDESEFSRLCAVLEGHVDTLENLLKCRSQDLLDARQRNDLNCSHSTLTMACEMIVTATKATFRYPDLATLKANREFAVHLAREAVNRLGCACDATYAPPVLPSLQGQAKSAEAGVEKTESWNSIFFQSNVRKLSAEIAALTESAGLADYFQAGIARCIHQLSEAVDQFIEAWDYETPNGLQIYVETMKQSCSRIRSFISQAALTLCSTIYITNDSVLSQIEEAAKCANEEKLVAAVTEIQQQTSDLLDSALCLCGVWADPVIVRSVRIAVNDLEQLAPQLINASKALALRNQSSTAKENFTLFAQAYRNMVKFLLENIDEVTDVIDFLDAQDRLLQEDIRKCQAKAEGSQTTGIMGSSRNLTARCTRAVKYILAKLENSEGSIENAEQTRTVLENIKENLVPQFLEATRAVCRSLKARSGSPDTGAIRRMGEAIRSAFGGLRPILEGLNQDRGEISSAVPDASLEMQPSTPSLPPPPPPPQQQPLNMKETQQSSASDEIIDKFRSSQSIQVQPPKGLNPNLNPLINRFNKERTSLMHHVRKLGGTGKDDLMSLVRTISFRLSEIVNYLTEPKKSAVSTETCLVQAAREISLMAAQLNGYCEKIARNFSDLKTRQNLFVSLKNINLFSHELAVMSRVKADLMNLNTEICLDNDESLIQSARNLLQAIKHALGDIRLIVEQKRVRSASSTLPPVPPKPYSRRTSTISSASPLSSYGVKIERTFDLSY